MNNRNWGEGTGDRIENKLREAEGNKQKAVNSRIKELQRELG